jgi:hypothetical protein
MLRRMSHNTGCFGGGRFSAWRGFAAAGMTVAVLFTPAATAAQTNQYSSQKIASKTISVGTPEMKVSGGWQFHPGDSPLAADEKTPLWADPSFDDSGWRPLQAAPLADQKLPYSQISWYRRQVTIDRQNPAQVLALRADAANTYQVYWNGRLLGGVGSVPPRFNWPYFDTGVFSLPLPDHRSVSGILAMRVWCQYPSSIPDACGLLEPPIIGDAALEQGRPRERRNSFFTSHYLFAGVAALALLAAIVAFLVYLRGRRDPLYLWFTIFLVGAAAFEVSTRWIYADNWGQFKAALENGVLNAGFLMLLLWLFGLQHRPRLRRTVAAVAVLIAAVYSFDGVLGLFWAQAGRGMQRADAVSTVLIIILTLAPLVLLGIAVGHRGAKRDWPVILAGAAFFLSSALVNITGSWPNLIHWHLDWIDNYYRVGYFDYSLDLILLVLLLLALGFSVLRHFLAERRRQEHTDRELLAAREVQRVLVPDKLPELPGYAIASVYRPAAEVGGDFFQILPAEDGSALVVIGDVSGKGVKAAMIVSLIVGTLRTVADFTEEPAEILKQLNTRLHGRMPGGFVTCLVLRIGGDHSIVAAHAGHISPYIDGKEFVLEGSVPLGVVPGMQYDQVSLRLAEGETLTLLTDGVPEAQNAKRELFGFTRLAALLAAHPSAEQVVETACAFGQQDDITVLTLTRLADASAREAVTLTMALQEA